MKKRIALINTGFMHNYLEYFKSFCLENNIKTSTFESYEDCLNTKEDFDYVLTDCHHTYKNVCNTFHQHSILYRINQRPNMLLRLIYYIKSLKKIINTKQVYPTLTKVIVVSKRMKEDFIHNYNIPEEKFIIAYPGYNQKTNNDIKTFKEFDYSKTFIIGMSGVGFITKGGFVMLKAMRHFKKLYPNIKIITKIIYPKHKTNLGVKLYVWFYGLGDYVKFLDRQKDMSEFYSGLNCFVCPSIYEAFGRVVPEAMYEKIPVILNEHIGATDIIQDGVNGFIYKVDKNTALNLAQKIKEVYDNYNKLEPLVERAYQTSKGITWKNFAKKIFDGLYKANL